MTEVQEEGDLVGHTLPVSRSERVRYCGGGIRICSGVK